MWKTVLIVVLLVAIADCRRDGGPRNRNRNRSRKVKGAVPCGEYNVPLKKTFRIDAHAMARSGSDSCQWKFRPMGPKDDVNLRMRCNFNIARSEGCRDAYVSAFDGQTGKRTFCGKRKHEEVRSGSGTLTVTAKHNSQRTGGKLGKFSCFVDALMNSKHVFPSFVPPVAGHHSPCSKCG